MNDCQKLLERYKLDNRVEVFYGYARQIAVHERTTLFIAPKVDGWTSIVYSVTKFGAVQYIGEVFDDGCLSDGEANFTGPMESWIIEALLRFGISLADCDKVVWPVSDEFVNMVNNNAREGRR